MRIRIVGLNRYIDRQGNERLYWRRKGYPAVALNPKLSGAALAAEVARLEKKYITPKLKAKAGTLGHLIAEYKESSNHWRTLRDRTRKDYERVFTWLGEAKEVAATEITPADVSDVRDKARDAHEPKFANQVVTTLKMVFRYGKEKGHLDTNPALGLEKAVGGKKRPNRPLQPWEAVNVLDAAPAAFRPVVALAIYCGIREGDLAALPRNGIHGDWLGFTQGKSKRADSAGRYHEAPIVPDCRNILAKMEPHNATTLLASSLGKPWTVEGIKSAWERLRDGLAAEGKLLPGATFHGLRHSGATWLEENGYEEEQTKHFLGHGPKTVSGHYGRSAKRRKLVMEMGLVIERVLSESRGNVVGIGNKGS